MKRTLRLRCITAGPFKGRTWESDAVLRAGRLPTLEVALDDPSVSRKHADIRVQPDGTWAVRDLDSTNGTFVNGTRLAAQLDHPVRAKDLVQFGKVTMLVEVTADAVTADGPPSDQLVIAASTRSHFDGNFFDSPSNALPKAQHQLRALLQAGQHLALFEKEDDLLRSILDSCVRVLDAQRGAIVLADGEGKDGEPRLERRALAVGAREPRGRFSFSKRLIHQCYAAGESRLFKNVVEENVTSVSIADGAMSSVICVLLRTPRKKLGVMHLDRGHFQAPFTPEDLEFADALAAQVSAGIECAQLLKKQRELLQQTITMLAEAVELRDPYTGNHVKRVTRYAELLAVQFDLSANEMELVRLGAPLHDIGKVVIPEAILCAPRRLTADEYAKMKTHTTIGADWVAGIAMLKDVSPIVRHHHERWDGTGYPDGLAGDDIPLLARIVAVADSFDAMTDRRPYHGPNRDHSPAAAFAELAAQAGKQFDPDCVAKFLDIQDEVVRVLNAERTGASDSTRPPPSSSAREIAAIAALAGVTLPPRAAGPNDTGGVSGTLTAAPAPTADVVPRLTAGT